MVKKLLKTIALVSLTAALALSAVACDDLHLRAKKQDS